MPDDSLSGLNLLSFESRRATEIAQLISGYGGHPISAPSMREIPLVENDEIREFHRRLRAGEVDIVVFLTGVGTTALFDTLRPRCPADELAALMQNATVVARGPKPRAALRSLGLTPDHVVPQPNTWRELLALLSSSCGPLERKVIAVQEYGRSNPELGDALSSYGAIVLPVPVYRWALPEDLDPLKDGLRAMARGDVDVALFTSAQQCAHVLQIAEEMALEPQLRAAAARLAIASIGPIATEALVAAGFTVDIEPVKPKMGPFLRQIALDARAVLADKRAA